MDFVAVVDQAIVLLRQRGRLTYRTLQLQFKLDDAHLEVRVRMRRELGSRDRADSLADRAVAEVDEAREVVRELLRHAGDVTPSG